MPLDNLSLAYLIEELRPFAENAYVNKVSELKNGFLKLKLHTKGGSKDLILCPNDLFVTSYSLQARHGKSNLANALKKELYNKKIVSISLNEFDRVVVVKFLEHSLILELIGKGNKILVDSEGQILSCQRNETWQDRTIKKGETYVFPKPRGINPAKVTPEALEKHCLSSEKDALRAVLGLVNVSPVALEEILFECGVKKDSPSKSLKKADFKKISSKILEFYSLKKPAKPMLCNETVIPFEFASLKAAKPIPSINSRIDSVVSSEFSFAEQKTAEDAKSGGISKLEFNLKQQEEAGKKFEAQIEENRRKAELIYENYSELNELKGAVQSALKKGLKEKEIMYKLDSAALKGNKAAKLIREINPAKKKIIVEL